MVDTGEAGGDEVDKARFKLFDELDDDIEEDDDEEEDEGDGVADALLAGVTMFSTE